MLGKKSWNVYNTANIEKVKRDEAAAAAREEAEEQRMQEVDAERRIQQLRGLDVVKLPQTVAEKDTRHDTCPGPGQRSGRERKRRKMEGEDDTDRDLRYARESQALVPVVGDIQSRRTKTSNAPLIDHAGHINLFPQGPQRNGSKNEEAEKEAAKKKREYEDQYTMRLSNAAGFKQSLGQKPWYQSIDEACEEETVSKDVWGNEDPRRKERDKMRVAADDPLAMIQKGVSDLRKVGRERKKWKEEREKEIKDLIDLERKHEKREKRERRRSSKDDRLDGFRIDSGERSKSGRRRDDRDGDDKSGRSHHRHSQSGERERIHKHTRKRKADVGWAAGPNGKYSTQFAEVQT